MVRHLTSRVLSHSCSASILAQLFSVNIFICVQSNYGGNFAWVCWKQKSPSIKRIDHWLISSNQAESKACSRLGSDFCQDLIHLSVHYEFIGHSLLICLPCVWHYFCSPRGYRIGGLWHEWTRFRYHWLSKSRQKTKQNKTKTEKWTYWSRTSTASHPTTTKTEKR